MSFVTVKATGSKLPHIELRFDPGVDYVQTKSYYLSENDLENPLIVWSVFEAGRVYDCDDRDSIKKYLTESALGLFEDYEIGFPVDVDKLVEESLKLVTDMLPMSSSGDYLPCHQMGVYFRGEPAELLDYDHEALANALADKYRK